MAGGHPNNLSEKNGLTECSFTFGEQNSSSLDKAYLIWLFFPCAMIEVISPELICHLIGMLKTNVMILKFSVFFTELGFF